MAISRRTAVTAAFAGLFMPGLRGRTAAAARLSHGDVLDLPEGFTCRVIDEAGRIMSDGFRVPGRPDGMGCFPIDGGARLALMRNHELGYLEHRHAPFPVSRGSTAHAYDARASGGVSRLVVDARTFEPVSRNLVLAGTLRNCGGGMAPQGWLSCEESVMSGHGYVFLCDPNAASVQPPRPIRAYGRFNHEAAAVDPATGIAYLTEDRDDGCLYRVVPSDPAAPFEGRLEALVVAGRPRYDTASHANESVPLAVEWVAIDSPDPRDDSVRVEARRKGAASVRRGEGLWLDGRSVWFAATTGGPAGKGQIFRLDPDEDDRGGALHLVAQARSGAELDHPDNITVSPWGDLFVAEDGGGDQYIRVVSRDGRIRDFARNAVSRSELAGVCFDPTGEALFVNVQEDGLTLVITGPFRSW